MTRRTANWEGRLNSHLNLSLIVKILGRIVYPDCVTTPADLRHQSW